MDSRKSIRVLAKSIHSLLGLKKHLTSNWVDSVFNIIKSSPSQGPLEIGCNKYKNDVDLGIAILKIRDELAALTANGHQLNTQRRQVLNDLLDLKGNIRVFCRVRPITRSENLSHQTPVVTLDSSRLLLNFAENKSRIYSFDKIFHAGSSQDDIFQEVDPLIKSALDGYNACIFAYGQTSTGKTFTMEGTADNPGVIPRAIEAVFKQAADDNHTFLFSFSMLELYMGHLKDLLVPQTIKATDLIPPCLSIQTNSKGEIDIDNLVTIRVSDFNHAKRLYRLGCRFRSTASTNLNKSSSRSHSMIRILMTCFDATERRRITNKLWMIDLGGSERVLKTKACGRRFEEGKAINLSLSALGDVINALQRKKSHIPYRNSKLTQVLKDSLGEDSKTLMLVHVSPREEDLCETLCSLNFATRVRSIHLGKEESTEAKVQKEIEMISLQQRMKWIEDKCHQVRRAIKKLNEKLEELTEAPTSSSKQLEASHLSLELEVPQSNIEIAKNIGNITASLSSELPRYMRPTICSRRKSGVDHQTLDGKKKVSGRKRRPQSYRAESVTLPIKGISEYNSESSMSRTNCLVGSKLKFSSDNETDSSQNKSEYDVKMIIFPTQDKSPRSSKHKKPQSSCSEEHGNGKMHEFDSSMFSKIDDWLHLQKNAYYTSTCTYQNKWILGIPNPEKNSRHNQQGVQKQLPYEKVGDYKLSKEKIDHEELNRLTQVGAAGRSRLEVVANIMPVVFKDFSNGDSRSNSISPTHTNDGVLMIQAQEMEEEFSVEEYICRNSTPPESCSILNKKKHGSRVGEMPMQLIACETQFSESLMLNSSWPSSHSASDVSGRTTAIVEDVGVSISRSELKSRHKKEPYEISKNSEKEEFHASSSHFEAGIQQRLSINKPDQVDLAKPIFQSQGKAKSTGICNALKQKVQILYTSALLGLGFQSLGLEHDFFYALML